VASSKHRMVTQDSM